MTTGFVCPQGPAPEPYKGRRQWSDLAIPEQDRFLLACAGGDAERNSVMVDLDLKWGTAWSLASSICWHGAPPQSPEEKTARLETAIRWWGVDSKFSRRVGRAVARSRGERVEGPEPEIPMGTLHDEGDVGEETSAVHTPRRQGATPEPPQRRLQPSISDRTSIFVWLATAATGFAIMPMPYAYYRFLRLGLCVLLVWFLWRIVAAGRLLTIWAMASVPFIILYNPVVPIHLGSKPMWSVINLLTIGLLWLLVRRVDAERPGA